MLLKFSCVFCITARFFIAKASLAAQFVKTAYNADDMDLIPGLGWSPEEGKAYLCQYYGLENSLDCSPWGLTESDTTEQLSLSLGFPGSDSKESAMRETWVQSLGREDPLEKELAAHFSILAWRIPRTEEAGRLPSVGWQESDTTEN